MPADAQPDVLSLQDLLPRELSTRLHTLAPGISWALDTLAMSFGEELEHLDQAARDAFARLTLNYGENLHRFLAMAREPLDSDAIAERERKMALLRPVDLFAGLNEFDLGRIATAFEAVVYPPGTDLVRQGAEGEAVYFLEQGLVGIVVDGNQVAVRGGGTLFGEISCITGEPISATLRAVEECRLLRIGRTDFEQLVMRLPEVVQRIARIGFSRLDDITHRLSEVLGHMPDALLKIDADGVITGDISSKCFEYLDTDVLTGRSFADVFFKDHSDLRELWRNSYTDLWKQPALFHDPDFAFPRSTTFTSDGQEVRHYRINLFPCMRRGVQDGFDVAISDITEHKRIEEERERMERALLRQTRQFMLFRLGEERFGLPIDKVVEIVQVPHITPMPNAPPFLQGFFNLRGRIMPALNLHNVLAVPPLPEETATQPCVFIVELTEHGQTARLGLLVDGVDDILEAYESDIAPAEELAGAVRGVDYLQGIARVEDEVHLLLSVERLLTTAQQAQLAQLQQQT